MKNKPDSGVMKSHRSAEAQPGADWFVLQVLRRNLQVMSDPIPGITRRLLQQERKFRVLNVRPKAMLVEGEEQTAALRGCVQDFPFSEQQLISEIESSAHRQPVTPGTNTSTARGKSASAESVSVAGKDRNMPPAPTGERSIAKEALARNIADRQRSSLVSFTAQTAKEGTTELPTAELLQQWVDEILSSEKENHVTKVKHSQKFAAAKTTGFVESASLDSTSGGTLRTTLFPDNEHLSQNPERATPGEVLSRSSVAKANKGTPEWSSTAQREKQAKTNNPPGTTASVRKFNLPESNIDNSLATLQTKLAGVALLWQLVEEEKIPLVSDPGRPKVASDSAAKDVVRLERERLADQGARSMDKNQRLSSIASLAQQENFADHRPILSGSGVQGVADKNDCNRVAELVNEALVEQAMRNGVDLS